MLRVPATTASPVIDGKVDEPCWQAAARTGPLKVASGTPGKSTTEALLLRDADHLYVGLTCAGVAPVAEAGQAKPSAKAVDFAELLDRFE